MFNKQFKVIDGIRIHYVDEGSGPPILLVHGQPTWSYLYRNMIKPLTAAGYRCIAPDLMGFGLSDKPSNESAYTMRRHVELVTGFVEKLQLKGVTIVGQDWGGPISLGYAIGHQDNVRSMVILNTVVRMKPIPLLFTLAFRNGGFFSFLIRNLDVFRKVAFPASGRSQCAGTIQNSSSRCGLPSGNSGVSEDDPRKQPASQRRLHL